MTGADLMLYRRMRGVFWGLLTIGLVGVPVLLTLGFGIATTAEWVSDETRQDVGRPGALMAVGIGVGGFIALVSAVVLGATAGSVDLQRGVLRDLVLAGRPRWRIVLGRLVAAAAWLLAFMVLSFGLSILVGLLLAPVDSPTEWEDVWRMVGLFGYSFAYTMPFAAGVALLVGSRGPAIAVFFAVAFVIDGVLNTIPKVSDWWQHVSLMASSTKVDELISEPGATLDGEVWRAIAVVVGWAVVPLVAGIVRLTRRDL